MMHPQRLIPQSRRIAGTTLALSLGLTSCGFRDDPQWLTVHSSAPFAADTLKQQGAPADTIAEVSGNCESRASTARSQLASEGSRVFRSLVQRCASEGLAFTEELRCLGDELQVRCE